MLKHWAFTLIACWVFSVQAQTNFPTIGGKTLADKEISIPVNNNKITVLAIAFNRDAEDALRTWLNPLYHTFVHADKNSGGLSAAEVHDVNFYFIPLISGFKKLADDFKSKTDKEFWPYILDTEKTDIKGLQKKLGVTNTALPWFYVLDKNGKILETVSGSFNSAKLDELEDAVDEDGASK